MILNGRQRHLLVHLDKIRLCRTPGGRFSFFLGDDDYSSTVDTLVVRGSLIKLNGGTQLRPTAVAEAFLT